jgi:hypothetical protein
MIHTTSPTIIDDNDNNTLQKRNWTAPSLTSRRFPERGFVSKPVVIREYGVPGYFPLDEPSTSPIV